MYKFTNKNNEIDWIVFLRKLYGIFRRNFYVFLVSASLAMCIAFLYVKYTRPVYEVFTSLIIKDDGNNSSMQDKPTMDMMASNITSLLPGNNNVENQMYVLGSYDNIIKTIEKLDFKVVYYGYNLFLKRRLMKNFPFSVVVGKDKPQLVETEFNVELVDKDSYRLTVDSDGAYLYHYGEKKRYALKKDVVYEGEHKFGDVIVNDYFSLRIDKKTEELSSGKYSFVMKNPSVLAKALKQNLSIERVYKEAGVVKISLETEYPEDGINILKTFTDVYLQHNLNKKNAVVNKMIDFIESQFDNVSNTLKVSEDELQLYQSDKNVVDLSAQGEVIINKLNDLDNKRAEVASQLSYLRNLRKNILSDKGEKSSIVAPSVMGIEDLVLNTLVNKINDINIQRSALVSSLNNPLANPQVIAMDAQLTELKKSLLDNVKNIISQINIFSKDNMNRIAKNKKLLKELPSKQRGLVNIQRNNKINSELYSQLLERKLNYYILKASNIIDKDVVEEAKLADELPIRPRKMIIFALALMLGVLVPLGVIVLLKLFDNTISSKEDISLCTSHPFMGAIPRIRGGQGNKLIDDPMSLLSEKYRMVRFRLNSMLNGSPCPKILVTSSLPREGKTITAINVATSFTMIKKKVLVFSCDLRRPGVARELGLVNDIGISQYMRGESSIREIIKHTDNEYLDAIVSGRDVSDPNELIAGKKFSILIKELEKRYDYIVFDTPPLGTVSDALQILKFVDLKLLVVRSGKIEKRTFEDVVNILSDNKSDDVAVLLNADDREGKKFNRYGYLKYKI